MLHLTNSIVQLVLFINKIYAKFVKNIKGQQKIRSFRTTGFLNLSVFCFDFFFVLFLLL